MCATYGLGGAFLRDENPPPGLPPMDERDARNALREWMRQRDGVAKITGSKAKNYNPLIRVADGARRLELASWWLHVNGAPAEFSAFNARDDKLTRSWSGAFSHRRAILPATWYIEKKVTFRLPDDDLFGMAAIYTVSADAEGAPLTTYAMVTRDAVGDAANTHPRMPLILPRDLHDAWLDPERRGDADLVAEARLASDEISRAVVATGGGSGPAPTASTLF